MLECLNNETNNIIYTTTGVSTTSTNTFVTVNRTFVAGGGINQDYQIRLYTVGTQYFPELTTESGLSLTEEDGITVILLG